jgi:tRNA threonylcarbamoyladenosine biosynthesis protein TsaB
VNILGLDTATTTTSVAVMRADGAVYEAEDVAPAGSRGRHAEHVLSLAAEVLERAGLRWRDVDLIAVGLGPGGYTGLRIGLASARGLALAHGAPLAGVGTLRALAEPLHATTVLAIVDARRGELFTAAYRDYVEVLAPSVTQPGELPALLGAAAASGGATALGDGAQIHRDLLEGAGFKVPGERSALHRVSAGSICRIAAAGAGSSAAAPIYLRRPDAERSLAAGR